MHRNPGQKNTSIAVYSHTFCCSRTSTVIYSNQGTLHFDPLLFLESYNLKS